MKTFSTSHKIAFGILAVVLNAALLYGMVTILFIGYIAWVGNIIMFYLNIWTFALIIFIMGSSDEDAEYIRKNKSLPTWVHMVINVAIVTMFVVAGWWYYAILCLVMTLLELELYGKK